MARQNKIPLEQVDFWWEMRTLEYDLGGYRTCDTTPQLLESALEKIERTLTVSQWELFKIKFVALAQIQGVRFDFENRREGLEMLTRPSWHIEVEKIIYMLRTVVLPS